MLCETEAADRLNEKHFHPPTAGGAYGTVIQLFLGYHCKHSSTACVNAHLNALYRGKMKRTTSKLFWKQPVPFRNTIRRIRIKFNISACYDIFSSLRPSSASLDSVNGRLQTNYDNIFPHKWHLGK